MVRVWLYRPLLVLAALASLLIAGAGNAQSHAPKSLLSKAIAECCLSNQEYSPVDELDPLDALPQSAFWLQTDNREFIPDYFVTSLYLFDSGFIPTIRAPPVHF